MKHSLLYHRSSLHWLSNILFSISHNCSHTLDCLEHKAAHHRTGILLDFTNDVNDHTRPRLVWNRSQELGNKSLITVFAWLYRTENLDVVALPDRDVSDDVVEYVNASPIVNTNSERIRVSSVDFLQCELRTAQ